MKTWFKKESAFEPREKLKNTAFTIITRFTSITERKTYLLCRKINYSETRSKLGLLKIMQQIWTEGT